MRLIDADALKAKLYFGDDCWIKGSLIKEHIDNAPDIDFAPVRHGHWEDDYSFIKCSSCRTYETKYDHLGNMNEFDYCPNCGARMDGDPLDIGT